MSEGPVPPVEEVPESENASFATALATEPAPDPLLSGFSRSVRVLIVGGTGFLGRHAAARLSSRGHHVGTLSRRPASAPLPPDVEHRIADITDPRSLRGATEGFDTILHLAGIASESEHATFRTVHVEGTRNLVEAAHRSGVRRFLYVSVLGAGPGGGPFFRTKWEAEREVVRSGLEHLIFRPSVVYGPGDHFTTALVALLRHLPVFPVLGVGSLRLQPVAVEDVTEAFVQGVERDDLTGGVYELAGPERLKLSKLVRIVARVTGYRRPIVQVPRVLAKPALWLAARLGLPAPLTPGQLAMLREASVLSRRENALRNVFRVEPMPFRDAVRDYL